MQYEKELKELIYLGNIFTNGLDGTFKIPVSQSINKHYGKKERKKERKKKGTKPYWFKNQIIFRERHSIYNITNIIYNNPKYDRKL